MQLTRAADYAVRVMVHLAGLPGGARVSVPELARVTEGPEQFLSKVLQQLVKARLLVSQRGDGGGFSLAQPPGRVSLLQVIEAIEGRLALNLCLTHSAACPRSSWCTAHPVWIEAQAAMVSVLSSATLASLARRPAGRQVPSPPRGELAWK